MSLVEVNEVSHSFKRGSLPSLLAVDRVSLSIERGETLALIGESGSGKSTLGRLILGLLPAEHGSITFDGVPLAGLGRKDSRALRSRMTVVFQEPYESLNPRMTVHDIVAEPLEIHRIGATYAERRSIVNEALERVGLTEEQSRRFPASMSGGQQQRVGIARAIVSRPQFIVLDEPTSSLDLSVRATILKLLTDLQADLDLAYLFISHDIHTAEYLSNRIAVMYLGNIVEQGPTKSVFRDPRHPYTRALLSARLSVDPKEKTLQVRLTGELPVTGYQGSGCVLYGRCPIERPSCAESRIELLHYRDGHDVACPEHLQQDSALPHPVGKE